MSLTERDRLAMFRQVEAGQLTLVEAALLLSISYRQTKRLWKRYREVGDAGLVHGLRGRPSNNVGVADERQERALALYREHYQGFGPTLAIPAVEACAEVVGVAGRSPVIEESAEFQKSLDYRRNCSRTVRLP